MFTLHNTMGCFILAILELSTTSQTKQRHQRSPTTPPRIVPFQFRDDLTLGSRTRITCEAAEGDLPLSFQWWHPSFDDLGDAPNTKIISVDDFSSTVSISSLTLNHTGDYTCSVTNTAGQVNYTAPLTVNCKSVSDALLSKWTEKSFKTLPISVPPRWRTEPGNKTCKVGEMVMFDCDVYGVPPPEIKWHRLHQPGREIEEKSEIVRYALLNALCRPDVVRFLPHISMPFDAF